MPATRDDPKWTMRKYQQLALAVVSFLSFVAFVFYKHEYERLRYTLEYLDTFGEPPPDEVRPQCGYGAQRLATPPADWVGVGRDLAVYSAYWEGGQVRAVGARRSSADDPGCLLWYEGADAPSRGTCRVERAPERPHGRPAEGAVSAAYVLCAPRDRAPSGAPHAIQFEGRGAVTTRPVLVHRGASRPAEHSLAVCLAPQGVDASASTLRLVEFVAHHHAVGAEKFVFYGPLLTPLARRLLDRYGDRMGLEYEEELFSPPWGVTSAWGPAARRAVELDCALRHADTHQNVLVLGLDQYVVLEHGDTLQDALLALGGGSSSEFRLTSRGVCLDGRHRSGGGGDRLLLAQRARVSGRTPDEEEGVAVLRPLRASGPPKSQHVSAATALVHRYSDCPDEEHEDGRHLPVNRKAVSRIEKSLLYRKWVVNH